MTLNELLQTMHVWLTEETFSNQISNKEGVPPFILTILGPDEKERERTLKLSPRLQETGEALTKNPSPAIISLEFLHELPFSVKEEAAKDVASLLHFINNDLYLPGFHLNEAEGKVSFRHFNYSGIHGIDKKLLIGVTGLILLYLDLYSNIIEDVATGKRSFNEVLEEIVKTFKIILGKQASTASST